MGPTFLQANLKTPYPSSHFDESEFIRLSDRCAKGDSQAMGEMAEYFMRMEKSWADYRAFCVLASNFWRYRAAVNGNNEAEKWIDAWKREHPGENLPSVLAENYETEDGTYNVSVQGGLLYALGFRAFDPHSEYYLYTLRDGLVLVSGKCVDHLGPDSDGFGEEWLYDHWYVDENLSEIPGLERMEKSSFTEASDAKYKEKALELLRNRGK
ncbi:MAG: hypothetical protein IJ088_03690 [Clostridia bacterium]|nr:hypothetical protein [Clostridia bacterium]